MKKVNLLFLCMIAFISCNEEQDLDLSVNQNDAGKEIVLKERDRLTRNFLGVTICSFL